MEVSIVNGISIMILEGVSHDQACRFATFEDEFYKGVGVVCREMDIPKMQQYYTNKRHLEFVGPQSGKH